VAQRLPHQEDAERALSEIASSVHSGNYIEPTKQTLAEFIVDWLTAIEPTPPPIHAVLLRSESAAACRSAARRVQLRRIDAGMLNGLYAALLADGKQSNGGGGLSPRSVHYVHTILHRAFRDAVRWDG
jgi:hypothetical protein